jgi:hypothetical protein
MPPESMILLLIGTWLLVAAATLWGMLRIARRHHNAHYHQNHPQPQPVQRPALRPAQARHTPARAGH